MSIMLVAGCAGHRTETRYENPNVTVSQRQRDEAECRGIATASTAKTGPNVVAEMDADTYHGCMIARGYTARRASLR
jgi:hypothetical protein